MCPNSRAREILLDDVGQPGSLSLPILEDQHGDGQVSDSKAISGRLAGNNLPTRRLGWLAAGVPSTVPPESRSISLHNLSFLTLREGSNGYSALKPVKHRN